MRMSIFSVPPWFWRRRIYLHKSGLGVQAAKDIIIFHELRMFEDSDHDIAVTANVGRPIRGSCDTSSLPTL